ncbi:MAG: sortase, partial [Lachnospiraceae bacterium]|nr:sortase [Lachnospiraceae bacterium]
AEEEALADDYIAMLMEMKAAKQAQASAAAAQPTSTAAAAVDQPTPAESAAVPTSGVSGVEASAAPVETQAPAPEVPTAAPEPAQPAQPAQPAATVDTNYEDNLYRFSPEYAEGVIECVLEVPVAKIRRGVYTGAIEHDLDLWMVVAARDEYVLGQTHYCIYGHNSTKQDLSFNNLQPNCKLGDTFTLTNEEGVYEYTITKLFSESRSRVTKNYVDNFNIDKNLCYIITCGRNEHRYKDFIVEGTLTKFTPLEELIK